MIPFERDGHELVSELDDFEVALISSLVAQVSELIGSGGVEASSDPFAQWAREMRGSAPLDRSDPVVARLFPDAYNDEAAAAEHRRYSQDALRRERIEQSCVVLADLAATRDGEEPLVIALEDVDAWLRTLNGVRISLAVRLGIESESDHAALEKLSARDPRTQLVALYDWLGFVLESLLEAAHEG
ncbi:MAG TPA: DUF2017 domain-containing protein [Propionibacterium sp.]|nr:DUF2017 domain-containing protein [Propionibacterium sp.]